VKTPKRGISGGPGGRRRAGFTLAELLIVIAIIGLLATLAFVVLSRSLRDSRAAVERQTIIALRNGVESFKQEFGFAPPLIDDSDPVNPTTHNPNVRGEAFLRSAEDINEPRYSTLSLPYYVFGLLGKDEDGVDGPGYTEPQRDGTFSRRGRAYPSRMDISSDGARLKRDPADPVRMAYVDRWGKAATSSEGWPAANPIRYYRWKPAFKASGALDQYLVPRAVGDPNTNIALRGAEYAIVSVGPDGVTDERRPLPVQAPGGPAADPRTEAEPIDGRVTADDIVEVGQ
jgi:prepilin-type N-terminal cleavage/methylation domain-containing protein